LNVLDLFSGLGGFSSAFKERNHTVITVDFQSKFKPTIQANINSLTAKQLQHFKPDIILASPPCNCFSCLTIRRYWPNGKPTIEALKSLALVRHTLILIEGLKPRYWVLENPVGMLRKQKFMKGFIRKTVTYCQYGAKYMKPTDLWGVFPSAFKARRCKNNSDCHVKTSRGDRNFSTGGIKDKGTPELRAKIPFGLSLELCLAAENKGLTQIQTRLTKG